MAEDPGVSTLAAIIEAMRQAFNLVHDTTKAVISAVVDTYRTRMYMSYRRQAGQNKESSLKHGKQSLKQLRRHEDHGAQIITAELGDRTAMKAIDAELKAAKIDYSITRSANGEYLLHYKQANEQDVLHAQNHAIQARFGSPLDAHLEASASQQATKDQTRETQEASEVQQREEAKQEHERTQEPQRQIEHDAQTRAMLVESDRAASRVIPAVAGIGAMYEPLESLKQEAKERAQAKNRARSINRERARDRMQTRKKTRSRAREYDFSH